MLFGVAEHRSWRLGAAARWDLDQRTGLISWTFPDKVATAPAQITASRGPRADSWRRAWANSTILRELSRDSRAIRDWALTNGGPQR